MGKSWKAYERWIAREIFDSERNALSGSNNRSDDGSKRVGDILHQKINVECKNYKNPAINKWLRKAVEESDKPALVFVHKKRRPYDKSSVTMPLEDFRKIKEDYERKVVDDDKT